MKRRCITLVLPRPLDPGTITVTCERGYGAFNVLIRGLAFADAALLLVFSLVYYLRAPAADPPAPGRQARPRPACQFASA